MLRCGVVIALLVISPSAAHAQEDVTRVTVLVDAFGERADLRKDVEVYVPNDESFGGPTPRAFFARSVPWKHATLHRVDAALEIAPGIRVVRNISSGGSFTKTPELSLVLDTPEGQVLVVGCSHPGIERILESVQAKTRPVRLLIGGPHWLTLPDPAVEQLAQSLAEGWNVHSIAPGHCTGELGFAVLNRLFGLRYRYAGLGTVITLE
jgi:7,8-dihydropterin-6-yl-methyl-4-(beta-D-ribofuranosyl)aminobenzene 5'-phosphate synthase